MSAFVLLNQIQVAVKTLPFYKDYFNIAYPLPKIDLIAIADFAAGLHQTIYTVLSLMARYLRSDINKEVV